MKPSYWNANSRHVSNCCIAALWFYSKNYILSIYGDDSLSQEMLQSILDVVGHVWPLLLMITISSCSTYMYVTGVWLQQQPEGSMVFIHRLSKISRDKTFNLFMGTDHTSVKFPPNVIKQQGRIGATITCTSDVLFGFDFVFWWMSL